MKSKQAFFQAILHGEYTMKQIQKCREEGRSAFLDWCKKNRTLPDFTELNEQEKDEVVRAMIGNGLLEGIFP